MKAIELGLVIAGAVWLCVWRGMAMYRQTFKRNRL
jgi:hypothetical protein